MLCFLTDHFSIEESESQKLTLQNTITLRNIHWSKNIALIMLYNILENKQHGKRYQSIQYNVQITQYNKKKSNH